VCNLLVCENICNSLRGEVWANKISFTLPLFIEVPVQKFTEHKTNNSLSPQLIEHKTNNSLSPQLIEHKKRPQQTTWEIHVLAYDKYRNLAGLSQFVHGIQERIELSFTLPLFIEVPVQKFTLLKHNQIFKPSEIPVN
jgi:endo-1,4-beta-D-glucanase Y